MINKRGLSSVIATVFLVLLSIVLASIILLWSMQFITEKIELDGQPIDEICKSILYDIQGNFTDGNLDLWIVNRGNVDIKGVDVKFIKSGNTNITRFMLDVLISDAGNLNITIPEEIEQLIFYPIVVGVTSGKKVEKPVRCEYSGKTFNIKRE